VKARVGVLARRENAQLDVKQEVANVTILH